MDFFAFIIIAYSVYALLSRKNKPPQKRSVPPPDLEEELAEEIHERPVRLEPTEAPRRKGLLAELEQQIKQAMQELEETARPVKPPTVHTESVWEEAEELEKTKEVAAEPFQEVIPVAAVFPASASVQQGDFSGEELRRGIIWSAVLQEPVGKRRLGYLPPRKTL